jgi:cytochrome c oxidase subunit 2
LRPHEENRALRGRSRRLVLAAVVAPLVVLLSGCSKEVERGWLPSTPETTNHTGRIMALWNGSWIAALVVGVVVWGLILWCVVAYRRRKDDAQLPPQIRYNIPLEILYTVVPLMAVGALFYHTAVDQAAITDLSKKPDLTINVVGKQWSWDFVYPDGNSSVYEVGLQGELTGKPGVEKTLPTLYLPVNKNVQFVLTSRDVIHSFWIPSFLYKLDVIPGLENTFQVVPQREGFFVGKCAELCGEYHSAMLFNVRVVSQAAYDEHIAALKAAGQTGDLSSNLGRSKTPPGGAVPNNPKSGEAAVGSN